MATKKRRVFDKIKNFGTTIGEGAHLEGNLNGEDNCIVQGKVTGNCRLEASLFISGSAVWCGDIHAQNVLIAGTVEGQVTALNQLEILPTGKVNGRLVCPTIAIAEGAVHKGEIRMSNDGRVTHFEDRRSDDR